MRFAAARVAAAALLASAVLLALPADAQTETAQTETVWTATLTVGQWDTNPTYVGYADNWAGGTASSLSDNGFSLSGDDYTVDSTVHQNGRGHGSHHFCESTSGYEKQ